MGRNLFRLMYSRYVISRIFELSLRGAGVRATGSDSGFPSPSTSVDDGFTFPTTTSSDGGFSSPDSNFAGGSSFPNPTSFDSGFPSPATPVDGGFTFPTTTSSDSGFSSPDSNFAGGPSFPNPTSSDGGLSGPSSGFSDYSALTDVYDRDDISFADDVVLLNSDHYNDLVSPNDASKIIFEDYEYTKGTEKVKRAWKLQNEGAPESDFASVTAMYATLAPSDPDVLFVYRGKAYACRMPVDTKTVNTVSDSVFELYCPDKPQLRSLYIQRIPLLYHLINDSSDDSDILVDSAESSVHPSQTDDYRDVTINFAKSEQFSQTEDASGASVDFAESSDTAALVDSADSSVHPTQTDFPESRAQPSQKDPLLKDVAFNNLFERLQVRGYGWIFLEDQIPVPLYKWHVSSTRITSFAKQLSRESFFTDKLKIPWNHLVNKFRTSRQKVVMNDSGDTQSTIDNAATPFWDRIAVKAFTEHGTPGYWKHLVDSFTPGSDSLQFQKHSNYYSNLMAGGRVPFTAGTASFKIGPRVSYDGKVTLKIARNMDGSFNVNYSFLRGWDIKAMLRAKVGIKTLAGWASVVIRPYKNQHEWNFVRSRISAESVAQVLESFADNTLTDVTSVTGDGSGNWKIIDGADAAINLGICYNLLNGEPSMTFAESPEGQSSASYATRKSLALGNVAITRNRQGDHTTSKAIETKWKVSVTIAAENAVQTSWTMEPPEVGPIQDDDIHTQIKGDTEDSGQRGLYTKSMTLNEQNRLIDLVTKNQQIGQSQTLDYKPTLQGRGYPQFTNPVRKMFGNAFYEELLTKAQEAAKLKGRDLDKRILSFNIEYALSDEAKQDLIDKHRALDINGWKAGVDKDRKTILKNPEGHREKLRLNVSMIASKAYKKGGTFGLPFLGRQKDGAEIIVSQKYQLFTDHVLPLESLFECRIIGT